MYPILLTAVLAASLLVAPSAALAAGPKAAPGASAPALVWTQDGVLASWVEPAGRDRQRLVLARWRDGAWSRPQRLVRSNDLAAEPPLLAADGDRLLLSWVEGEQRVVGALGQELLRLGEVPAGPAALVASPDGGGRLLWIEGEGRLHVLRVEDALGTVGTVDPRVCAGVAPAAAMLGDTPVVAWSDRDGSGAGQPTLGLGLGDDWEAVPVQPDAEADCGVGSLAVATQGSVGAGVAWWQGGATQQLRLALHGEDGQVGPLVLARSAPTSVQLLALDDGLLAAWQDDGGLVLQRVDAQGRVGAQAVVDVPPGASLAVGDQALLLAWTTSAGIDSRSLALSDLAAPSQPGERVRPPGPQLPDPYVLPGLDGTQVDVSAMRGQPLLVNLWASWCPPCLVELPALLTLHEQWTPRGLAMVGIAIDDKIEIVQDRITQHAIPWTVAFDGSGRASRLFQTSELPTTVLYDADGTRVWTHVGEVRADDPELQAALERLMPPAAPSQDAPGPGSDRR